MIFFATRLGAKRHPCCVLVSRTGFPINTGPKMIFLAITGFNPTPLPIQLESLPRGTWVKA